MKASPQCPIPGSDSSLEFWTSTLKRQLRSCRRSPQKNWASSPPKTSTVLALPLVTRQVEIVRAMKAVEQAAAALMDATGCSTVAEATEVVDGANDRGTDINLAALSDPSQVRHASAAETLDAIVDQLSAAAGFHEACAGLIEACDVETFGEAIEEVERTSPRWTESWTSRPGI